MKVILELLGDAGRVLEGVEGLGDFRPDTRRRVRELLTQLHIESGRILESKCDEDECSIDDREEFLERALEAISSKDHEVARGVLEDAVTEFPEDFEFLNYLGLVAWEQGDLRAAETAYHRAVQIALGDELDSGAVDEGDSVLRAVEGRALALYRLGELDRALTNFEWLGEHFTEEYVGCRYLAGEIHHLRGDIEEAIRWYERVPVEPAVLYNLGLAYYQDHRLEEAAYTLIRAFVSNVHIAKTLLGRYGGQSSCTPGYLGSDSYAKEFVDACLRLWHSAEGSLRFLERCFDHGLVQSHLQRCSEQGGNGLLQAGEGAMECGGWLEQLQDEATLRNMSTQVLRRLRS